MSLYAVVQMPLLEAERRCRTRYPLALRLRYRAVPPMGGVARGAGVTVDISSAGVAFDATQHLPVGTSVVLSFSWPKIRPEFKRGILTIYGKVIRSEQRRIAIKTIRNDFRSVEIHRSAADDTDRDGDGNRISL